MEGDKLKLRAQIKKRKPTFRRQQINQYAKFKNFDGWRRPKGIQSKMRLHRKGHRAMPSVGYGSPKEVKGLNRLGFKEIIVNNVNDLKLISSKEQVAVIGRTVGAKKRIAILEEAKKAKMAVSNVKDIDAKIKELTKAPKKAEKKAASKKTAAKTEAKVEESKTEAKVEPKIEESKTEKPKKETKKKEGTKK